MPQTARLVGDRAGISTRLATGKHVLLTFCAQALTDLSFLNSLEFFIGFLFSFSESLNVKALDLKRRAQAPEPRTSGFKIHSVGGGSECLGKFLPLSES